MLPLLMTSFVLVLYVLLVLTFWFPHRQRRYYFFFFFSFMRMLLYVLPLLTILFGASVVYVLLLLMTSFVLLLYVLLVLTFWFPHRQRQLLFLLLFFLWFSMQAFLVLKSRHTVPLGTVLREIQYCHKIVVTFCIGYGYCLNIVNVDIWILLLLFFCLLCAFPCQFFVLKLCCTGNRETVPQELFMGLD